jgi:predicted DNA-binding protein
MEPLKTARQKLRRGRQPRHSFMKGGVLVSVLIPTELWQRIKEKEIYLGLSRSENLRQVLEYGINAIEDEILAEDARILKASMKQEQEAQKEEGAK